MCGIGADGQLDHRHAVGGERAGFVAGEHAKAAERLDGCVVFDEHVGALHALADDEESESDHKRHAARYERGDGRESVGHQVVGGELGGRVNAIVGEHPHEHANGGDDREDDNGGGEAVELDVQDDRLVARLTRQFGHAAQPRLIALEHHDALRLAVCHSCRHQRHVLSLCYDK